MKCEVKRYFTCLACTGFPEFESETIFLEHLRNKHGYDKNSFLVGKEIRTNHIDYDNYYSDDTEYDYGNFRYFESILVKRDKCCDK